MQGWTAVLGDIVYASGVHAWDIVIGCGSDELGVGIRLGVPPSAAESGDLVSAAA